MFEDLRERFVNSSLLNDDLVVPHVNDFFVGTVSEADNPLQALGLDLLGVYRRKHLLEGPSNHLGLRVDAKPIHDSKRIFEGEAKRLPSVVKHILHSAVIDYPETHLSSPYLDHSHEVF